jgi:hypothetical protein
MTTKFLFLDDSTSPKIRTDGTKIVALTGLIVPAEKLVKIRQEFFQLITPLFVSHNPDRTKTIDLAVPELHGVSMLRDKNNHPEYEKLYSDEQRIDCFEKIASFPDKNNLAVYRVAYYSTEETKKTFVDKSGNPGPDVTSLSFCWDGMLRVLKPELDDSLIIPVMDSTDANGIHKFSTPVQMINAMHAAGVGDMISIENYQNIGEVYFADSKFSVLTQIVDVLSYLRCVNDQKEEGVELTDFKKKIYDCNKFIKGAIKHDTVIEWNVKEVDRIRNTTRLI